jgi:hypothetical protein
MNFRYWVREAPPAISLNPDRPLSLIAPHNGFRKAGMVAVRRHGNRLYIGIFLL